MNVFSILTISTLTACAVALLFEPSLRLWDATATLLIVDLKRSLKRLNYDDGLINAYMRLWGMVLTGALILGFTFGIPILAGIVAFAIFVAPREILKRTLKKRKRILKAQLITAVGFISNAVQAGSPVEEAVVLAAEETPEPLKKELDKISTRPDRNFSFEDALNESKNRLQLQEFAVLVTSLIVNMKRGGELKETLKEIQNTLVENQRLERKLEADTASGRMVINVLCLAPILFLLGGYGLNPAGMSLMFSTLLGQVILAFSAILVYTGYYLGQKVVDVEF